MELRADEADFTDFSQRVLARVGPHELPMWERVRLFIGETWRFQRGWLASGLAAAALVAVAIPVGMQLQAAGEGATGLLTVRSVYVDPGAHVAPVVMTNEQTGDAIIWLVDHDDHVPATADESSQDELPAGVERRKPSGGDL
jgi:hypothetical protein